MLRNLCVVSCLMMAACSDSTDKDTEDTDTVVECDNGIVSITPADGAQNVYYRSDISVLFEAADENATCTVTTGGTEVPGSTTWMGDTMMWTADAPMDSSTTYDVAISYECGDPTTSFTTSEVGAATTRLTSLDAPMSSTSLAETLFSLQVLALCSKLSSPSTS